MSLSCLLHVKHTLRRTALPCNGDEDVVVVGDAMMTVGLLEFVLNEV